MTTEHDICRDRGCGGIMIRHALGYELEPKPSEILQCNGCLRVLLVVTEPGRERVELWLDHLGHDESFREQVDRAYWNDTGPGGDAL